MTHPLAAQLTQAILAASAGNRAHQPFAVGVITVAPAPDPVAVDPVDPSADPAPGPPVTVTWGDGSYQATHLADYTPVVGDVVLMARPPNQLVILGRIA